MERVNNTFQHILRCLFCYDGTSRTNMLPQVEFACNTTRALGMEHTPFEANFGFSPKDPPYLLFSMQPSISVSRGARERLKLLQEVHALVHVIVHKDEMQARYKTVDSFALRSRRQSDIRYTEPLLRWTA
jgi:hypothetical protein